VGVYSIKDLEKLSGIKAHTIRIWEQRYNVLTPHRTDTNIRTYDDNQLRHLLNVSMLIEHGHKISKICKLSASDFDQELEALFQQAGQEDNDQAITVKTKGLIMAMMEMDELRFEKIFSTSIMKRGFEQTVLRLVYPFLERVGVMWNIDKVNPAQEHFIFNLIRQKVLVALDSLTLPPADSPCYVLFLPEGELHELGLLLSAYLLKVNGVKTIYLGQNMPIKDVSNAVETCDPNGMLTFCIVSTQSGSGQQYINNLAGHFPKHKVLVGGSGRVLDGIKFPSNIQCVHSAEDLLSAVQV